MNLSKLFDNVQFIFALLAGFDGILAAKLSMITGETVYWVLSIICSIAMIVVICQKNIYREES